MLWYAAASVWWKCVARPWLKKYWVYVAIFPVGIVVVCALLSKKATKVQVVSTELSGADKVKKSAETKELEGVVAARDTRDVAVAAAAEERDEKVAALVSKQKSVAADPPTDDDLTSLLLKAGKDARK